MKNYNREKVEKRLDRIMDNFDFDTVYKVMQELDWTWYMRNENDSDYSDRVPTLEEIKDQAANLLWELVNSNCSAMATGGFEVEKDFSDYNNPFISLKFVVSDWSEGVE